MSALNGGGLADSLSSMVEVSEQIQQLHISKPGDRTLNSRLFQRFLELLSMQCSNGSRFHCLERTGVCCHPCDVLRSQIATYVDVATLEEIGNTRKHGGLCSYVYCNKRLPARNKEHGRSNSTFKIDLAAQKVYRRRVYESFCCADCLERHGEAESVAEKSPMETGTITPRALRNSNPKTVQTLLKGLQYLGSCEGIHRSSSVATPRFVHHRNGDTFSEHMEDKCVMFNYKPLSEGRTVRFTLPDEGSDSSASHTTTENLSQEVFEAKGSISMEFNERQTGEDGRAESYIDEGNFDYTGLCEPYERTDSQPSILKSLNLFSILWYTLSTCVTYKTRAFLQEGVVESGNMDERTRTWYEAMLSHMPEKLVPLTQRPLERLLSTFRVGKNTPTLDDDYLGVMLYLLLYVLLRNREHVFKDVDISCVTTEELDKHMGELERILVEVCRLDLDSINVVNELLTECE